ncbi:MAG: AbrB/MazE/SpoVT family DNA-binding domain-containing protein [Alphaproteobacteria bacterium]|jgi:AbrB family looped-hinge helix DNA binding protein|nr:AbrB/MazE/SpoVT family DNA-binding domain-containing protein [Alphaproteobacteria bacterium]
MVKVTVTAKGQITLRKELLTHLGLRPGDRLEVDMRPGRLEIRPEAKKPVESIFGLLSKPDEAPLSLAGIEEAARAGWAGER